jgi:hypothetical protein
VACGDSTASRVVALRDVTASEARRRRGMDVFTVGILTDRIDKKGLTAYIRPSLD